MFITSISAVLQQGLGEAGSWLHRNLHYMVVCSWQLQTQELGFTLSFFLTLCIRQKCLPTAQCFPRSPV